ncbi:MAG: hypothetical protein KAR47_12270, partial [Planctomycetes bacterium]|nr:hypothetical protein [Planctomycetota bacterium]
MSKALRELYGSESIFMMRENTEGVSCAVSAGETVETLAVMPEPADERAAILNMVEEFEPNWLIVDLPYADIDTSYFPRLGAAGVKTCFIDDFRFIDPGADILLNSSILAPEKTNKLHP